MYAGSQEKSVTEVVEGQILECIECKANFDAVNNHQSGHTFMYLSLTQQLRGFFEKFHTDELYTNTRKKINKWTVEDLFDGTEYKNHVQDGTSNDIINVNFSIDGTLLFKSSQTSVTPILCTINELPPNQRKRNIMLVRVFMGSKKPDMNEYIKPFVAEMKKLSEESFEYVFNGKKYSKKVRTYLGITDSVERPELRCTTTFRGVYRCGLCKHPGVETPKGKGSVRVYPISHTREAFKEGIRTHEETLQHAEREEKGVKRISNLCMIPFFNIILGLPGDYMHSVMLGVVRQFCNIWFNPQNRGKPYCFIDLLEQVGNYLLTFKPSIDVLRLPRKMTDRKHWKAHGWAIWLLFYSLPTTNHLFPSKYVQHWSYLVDGVSILLKTSVKKSEIYYARNCLFNFVQGVEKIIWY